MAESLAHRWGQIIGDGFEMFVRDILGQVARRHGLYLDFKRPRATRGGQGKVTWQDGYSNNCVTTPALCVIERAWHALNPFPKPI